MASADVWFICRIGLLETVRAVAIAGGSEAARGARDEWSRFEVIEIEDQLCRRALDLALAHGLSTLDSLHLASALLVLPSGSTVATWDRRLHAASVAEGLSTLPNAIEVGPGRARAA